MHRLARELLLIEDDPVDAALFEESLLQSANSEYKITHITSIEELSKMGKTPFFDVIIQDMNLPGLTGFDAVRYCQKHFEDCPIIILTGVHDDEDAMRAVSMGVQDYLVKGENSGDLIRRSIRYAMQRKQYELKISYLTQYDQLTGLLNSQLFQNKLRTLVRQCKKDKSELIIYAIDIDRFKDINDLYGYDIGNMVLIELASRLQSSAHEDALLSRLGNNEFILVEPHKHSDDYRANAASLLELISQPYHIGEHSVSIHASIGMATYPECGSDGTILQQRAQIALYHAKLQPNNSMHFFTRALHDAVNSRLRMLNALRYAIANNELSLRYHPKISLKDGQVVGAEALVRWHNAELGHIGPDIFIPLAEETGLIASITQWVMQEACEFFHQSVSEDLTLAVNISASQLHDSSIATLVGDILQRSTLPANQLALELTETALMRDVDNSLAVLNTLKSLGVMLHIDDFGTGYSSLSYLKRFPIDALKIDRSFVRDMLHDRDDHNISKLIIALAHDLGMKVVAEGVENPELIDALRALGCDESQGYVYCKPLEAHEFSRWISNYNAPAVKRAING